MTTKPTVILRQLFDYTTWTYTYVVFDGHSGEGILIDGVKEQIDRDRSIISELGVELKYILDTHVHADHITSSGLLRQESNAKVVLGQGTEVECADILLKDGESIQFGAYSVKAIATPGHTSGCTSYYVEGMVFTGDALLIRGCGRTDFQQGNPEKLYESITQKLFTLPDETLVYPAHDYKGRMVSSIGEEKRYNPRAGQGKSKGEFVEIMNNLNLAKPKKIEEAVPANLTCGI